MVLDADRAFPALRERINAAGIGRTIVVSGRGNRKAARVIDADGTQGAEGLGRNAVSAAVKIAVAVMSPLFSIPMELPDPSALAAIP